MIQRILIILAKLKIGNTSEDLLNDIQQILYSLYWVKEMTKKIYNRTVNSIKIWYKNEYDIFEL